jgi:hypothetical protein
MCFFSFLFTETFWVFVTAAATIALAYIAKTQFSALLKENEKNNKVISETFLNQFKNSFFTDQERIFMLLVEKEYLKFESEEGVFRNIATKQFKEKFKEIAFLQRAFYLTQEIDDFLLGHFEDAALLESKGVIDLEDADQNFEYYLSTIFENVEIKEYIKWAREDDRGIYSKSEALYHKLKLWNSKKE